MIPAPDAVQAAVALAEYLAAHTELAHRYLLTGDGPHLAELHLARRHAAEEFNAWVHRVTTLANGDTELWGAWVDEVHAMARELQGIDWPAGECFTPHGAVLH